MKTGTILRTAVALLAITFAASMASAQAINSGAQAITLNATLAESLTLTLSAVSVNFTLSAGSTTNAGSQTITATTAWTLKPGRTAVGVYAYFGSATAALTDGAGDNIPSSAFSITDNAKALGALTATVPTGGGFGGANAGLQLENIAINGTNKTGKSVDTMAFNIDLSGGTLPQLPAATYTGTLNIQAQATP